MRFTVSMRGGNIRSQFKLQCEFIDAYVDRRELKLFADVPDKIFSMMTLQINSMQDFEPDHLFRIPKESFLALMEDGTVSFYITEGDIYVSTETKNIELTMKFKRQICSVNVLEDKLALIAESPNYPRFYVEDLITPIKMMRTSHKAIVIEDGVAVGDIGALQMYAKTKCADCAIFPADMTFLMHVCGDNFHNVFNVRDFIVYTDGVSHVAVRKAKADSRSDVQYLVNQKVIHKMKVDFEQATYLLAKIKSYTHIDLNLETRKLVLVTPTCEYSAPIKVEFINDDANAEKDLDALLNDLTPTQMPTVNFPSEVFKHIITAAKTKSLEIFCSKKHIRVSLRKGLMFACRRT